MKMLCGSVVSGGRWILLLGCLLAINEECYSRAVNISNTWTLPQEGFSVFYRFFRDKISWFEADAVCQFHHANLVTVGNGVQFDAARAFLKELDVTEFVWIGLMRPQSNQHFLWTNSKPLDIASGYWADPFPLMESPLCAVIDPVRDFRWHALRCGGPETAAFLCEMEVPDWASECTIRSMPSLTVQYMSDSGTVELSRDCGEEGTRHMACRGREDHEAIFNELTCIDGSSGLDASTSVPIENALPKVTVIPVINASSTTTTRDPLEEINQKTVELIHNVASDNNEDNSVHAGQLEEIEIPVKKVTYKFNLEDIMFGDQPVTSATQEHSSTSETVATVTKKLIKDDKRSKKFQIKDKWIKKSYAKKPIAKKEKESVEEMMLGDQPVSEEQFDENEPLPHTKKSLPIDLKQVYEENKIDAKALITTQESPASSSFTATTTSTTTTTAPYASTTEIRPRRETPMSSEHDGHSTEMYSSPSITETPSNIAQVHPPKITKKISNSYQVAHKISDSPSTSSSSSSSSALHHISKEKLEVDETLDHFIPPMLLVRTKFTLSKSHIDNPIEVEDVTEGISMHSPTSTGGNDLSSSVHSEELTHTAATTTENSTESKTTESPVSSTQIPVTTESIVSPSSTHFTVSTWASSSDASPTPSSDPSSTSYSAEDTQTIQTNTTELPLKITTTPTLEHLDTTLITKPVGRTNSATEAITLGLPVDLPKFRQPHAPQRTAELHLTPTAAEHITTPPLAATTTAKVITIKMDDSSSEGNSIFVTTTTSTPTDSESLTTAEITVDDKAQEEHLETHTSTISSVPTKLHESTTTETHLITDILSTIQTTIFSSSSSTTGNGASSSVSALHVTAAPPVESGIPSDTGEDIETSGEDNSNSSDFTNADNFQPYRPNRSRALTKPETHNYLKKILG